MKAAVLEKLNAPLVVEDVELGTLQYGQVLVKVIVSGICGSQLKEIAGEKGNEKFLPHLLGHEGCGTVVDVGVGVTRVKAGDRVVMHWRKASGIESPFPKYIFRDRMISSGRVTTFSEYSIVSENRVTPVPFDTPPEFCALLGCGLSTALATFENEAEFKMGETVLIVGCGGLGVNAIRAAKLMHASWIVSADIYNFKRELALQMGADAFVNCKGFDAEAFATAIHREAAPLEFFSGFDVIIDTTGARQSIENTVPLLAATGRYIMVGHPKPGEPVSILNANHMFGGEGKVIRATQGGGFVPDQHIPRYVKLWQRGALDIQGIIGARVPLADINRGLDMVRHGDASRIIVEMVKS